MHDEIKYSIQQYDPLTIAVYGEKASLFLGLSII